MPAGRPYKPLPSEKILDLKLVDFATSLFEVSETDAEPAEDVAQYYDDPLGFVLHAFVWRHALITKAGPNAYQREILEAFPAAQRYAVRGPHGLGKTTLTAWIVLWFALTREAKGIDWKVATTAGSWHQLTFYLWPEIHKWARRLRPDYQRAVNMEIGKELMQLRLRLQHGEAFGVASNRPELIEGAHATEMMYAFDEAKSIGPSTWDAAEGAFSAGGADAELRAFALATSTPGEPNGRFYDIHHRAQGYEDWTPRHVTLEESIAAGRIAERWAELRQAQWGVDSAIYQNRVLGEFATSDADAIIPLAWVEAAQQRWLDWWAVHKKAFPPLEQIGADIGRGGNDSAFAKRIGHVIAEVEHSKVPDTMEIAGRIKALLDTSPGCIAQIDVNGLGAGVYDRLLEQKLPVHPFNAGGKSPFTDESGQMGFINRRAEVWWRLREMLNPAYQGEPVALPNNDKVTGDLTTPHWRVTSSGNIQVESKEDIYARLRRSTDDGDAIAEAFAPPVLKGKRQFRGAAAGKRGGVGYAVR
jgi:hypothetical protein